MTLEMSPEETMTFDTPISEGQMQEELPSQTENEKEAAGDSTSDIYISDSQTETESDEKPLETARPARRMRKAGV